MKRKEFIYNSGLVLGAALLGCKAMSSQSQSKSKFIPNFDLHTHPGAFYLKTEESDQNFINRISDMKSQGLDGAFFCLVADYPLLKRTETGIVPNRKFEKNEGWEVFTNQLSQLKGLIAKSDAKVASAADELSSGEHVKAYVACEGGDFLGGEIAHVENAYEMGVRSIQIVHYAPNELGDLQTWKVVHGGLSAFGKEVVTKMNEIGILIDVAHASARTVKMVTDLSSAPVMLSHSILKDDLNRPINARAISADHAKMVTSNGGIIGMWPSGFSSSFEEFVDHTFRMIDAVGIDHVGIGTDMDSNYKPVLTNYTEFFDWTKALFDKGLSEEEVNKLAGGNADRILKEVLT